MASTISSLGIGSGVLTADVIDQLKEADTSRIIKPIENKITINNQQQDAYELLSSLMTSFKTSASALSYSTIFDNKTVDVNGEAEVSIDAGASVESFTLETTTLAKKDITSFGSFSDKTSGIATGDGVLKINDFEVAYTNGTTLEELAQLITEEVDSSIDVSILQTGDGEYSLVLASKETGADQAITVTDTDDGTLGTGNLDSMFDPYDAATNLDGYKKIQTAVDAEFIYNGITVTRSTNEIDDLILGVNIKLKEEGDVANVGISQDKDAITGEMQLFVDSYNTLMTNLADMTVKDKETGAEGVFNGESFIKSISRELTKTITELSSDGQSLMNFGIELERNGTMTFDKSVLETKLDEDQDAVKLFFSGGEDANGNDVKTQGENLAKTHLSAQESLDARYAIMTRRFIAYDAMISKINSQFSSLQMMIDAEANS